MRAAFVLLLSLSVVHATLIDRIAITVGTQAITSSEIERDIQLAALLNGTTPVLTPDSKREAAARLVEQALIRREMSFGSYPAVPAVQVDQAVASTEKARGGAAALDRTLTQYRLKRKDLRDYLEWQLALLKFIELRFRPAVQVTDEDVESYYKAHVPVKPGPDGAAPSLQDLHDQIQAKLTGDRVDTQLNEWIERSKMRTSIHYIDALLAPSVAPVSQ